MGIDAPAPTAPTRRVPDRYALHVAALLVGLIVLVVVSFGLGRYVVAPWTVLKILVGQVVDLATTWLPTDESVVLRVRLPRILGALVVGAALAAAGGAYQTTFRNPLVSPDILGVSAAAGFGGSLALLLHLPASVLQLLAFAFGLVAALLSLVIGRVVGGGSIVVLVLGGIVVAAMFNALIAITQFLANPETTLPEITFWLLGGLGRVTMDGLVVPAIIVAVCLVVLYGIRWPLTVLAAGEDEARALGIDRNLVWLVVIGASTLMTATVVSIAGIVGWVGLVVPHLARFLSGPSFARLLPISTLIGAGYLLLVDDLARSASTMELPLGVLTALIGAPFFVVLLARARKQWL